MRNNSSIFRGIAGGIVLIGLAISFALGGFSLPIFFIALALAALVSSFGSARPLGVYGGIQSFFWLLMLALFFATGFNWIWLLVAAGVSAILGALMRPILAGLGGLAIFGMSQQQPSYQPQQQPPYYQPSQQPYQPQQPPQTYQGGYQPETYQEGGQQRQYPQTPQSPQPYEQPQAQYPQEMPPQQ